MTYATVTVTDEEFKTQQFSDTNFLAAKQLFQLYGVLKLNNILSKEKMDSLYKAYIGQLDFTDDKKALKNALRVGEARYMAGVDIRGEFNDVQVYANQFLYPVMQSILGENCVLNSFGSVLAFPGSESQHFHFDHPSLFPENEGMSSAIPSYAVTVAMPLVDVTKENGPTVVWAGSNHIDESEPVTDRLIQGLEGERGCCYLWDYRVLHGGLPNNSKELRPLLYFVYARPWFNDAVNFDWVKPLSLSDNEFEKIPEKYKGIFVNR